MMSADQFIEMVKDVSLRELLERADGLKQLLGLLNSEVRVTGAFHTQWSSTNFIHTHGHDRGRVMNRYYHALLYAEQVSEGGET